MEIKETKIRKTVYRFPTPFQIEALIALTENQYSFSKAAEALETSQSNISRHIGKLEDELCFKIVSRSGTKIEGVTDEGKEIIKIAKSISKGLSKIRTVAEDNKRALEH